jgi:hypothetical protein
MDGFVVKSFSQLQYPEIVHSGPKYKFPSNFQFRRIPKSSKTFTNIIIAPRIGGCIWWEIIFTTSVPQNSAFKSETQVSNQFTISKVSEILQNTHKHHYWYERLEWMHLVGNDFATSVPQNSAFLPETQVLLHFTFRRFPKCSKTHINIIIGPRD